MAVIVVFTVIFLFIPLAKLDKTQYSLTDVISTIKKLVSFYKAEYQNINIDGLYGLRVLEGHTIAIVKKYEGGGLQHLSGQTLKDLKTIRNQVSIICEQALQYVRKDDKGYFEQLKFVVSAPWDIFEGKLRKVDLSKEWAPDVYKLARQKVHMDEEKSDKCMSELIGSHRPGGAPCDISSQCIFMMTSPGLLGYGITHQLLWTMLAEKAGCREQLEQKLVENKRPGLAALRLELCTNNYIQLINTLKKFHNMVILPVFQDLYLEQLFVCPSLGFYELLDIRLLPQIISWQRESGCYGTMKRPSHRVNLAPIVENTDYDYDDSMQELVSFGQGINLTDVTENSKTDHSIGHNITGRGLLGYFDFTVVKGRKLLVEKSMTGGCLAHKTGVAAGALVIFLRLLCEPEADAIFNHTLQVKLIPDSVPRGSQVSRNLTHAPNNNLKFQKESKSISNVRHGLNEKSQQENIVDPNEIKPIRQAAKVNVNSTQNLINSNQGNVAHPANAPQLINNQANDIPHNRVLHHNDPPELKNLRATDLDNKENKIIDPAKHSENEIRVGVLSAQKAKPKQNIEKEEVKKSEVQNPVELNMPNDDGDAADDDENGDYDGNDDYDYDDDDNEDDDGYDDEADDDNNDNKHVPLQKDPDYVDKEENTDNEYNQENYDEGHADDDDDDDGNNDGAAGADYDNKPKSANNNKFQKSLNNVVNKDVLKGNINSRNIVNRNDFQAENDYADNKRYDDKVRQGKNAHDRYAYDDYRNGGDDNDDDDDDGDEYDYDDKNEHHEVKDTNSDIKLESVIHSKDTAIGALRNDVNISKDHTVSSNTALFVFAFCFVSVVLLAYRFIKKRRIHFRFHPRISHRV